jgi:hypothetical protein
MAIFGKKSCRIAFVFIVCIVVLASAVSYVFYREHKGALLTELSNRAGLLIGHKVSIGNISFTYPDGLYLYDIQIQNPESFPPGNLLTIKKVFLETDIKALISGRFSSRGITVVSPELILVTNKEGRMNISDTLRHWFRKKTASRYEYEIDSFRIVSGIIGYQQDDTYTYTVDLDIQNLSSDPGTKTLLHAAVTHNASEKMALDGWAYMRDSPQKFDIAISAENVHGDVLRELSETYNLDLTEAKTDLNIAVQGDTNRGAHIAAKIRMTDGGTAFRPVNVKHVGLDIATYYDIARDTVFINKTILTVSRKQVFSLKGEISDLFNTRAYQGTMQIHELDLSDINFYNGLTVGGKISSDNVRFRGTFRELLPEMSGSVWLRNGYVQKADFAADNLQAHIELSRAQGLANASADISARIRNVPEVSLREPLGIDFSIHAQQRGKKISLASSINLSPVHISMGKEKSASISHAHITLAGSMEDSIFSADASFLSDAMSYGTYSFNNIDSTFRVQYANSILSINDLHHTTKRFSGSFSMLEIKWIEDKRHVMVKMEEIDTAYPSKKMNVKAADLNLYITRAKPISGTFNFSGIAFFIKDKEIAKISGTGVFNSGKLLLSVSDSLLGGGRVRVQAEGLSPSKLFPLSMEIHTENLDMAILSDAGSAFMHVPYVFSGRLDRAVFRGSIHDLHSVVGKASVHARAISMHERDGGKTITDDASLKADILATGEDIQFKIEPSAGVLSPRLSGSVKDVFSEGRSYHVNILVPETGISEIRNSFWDIIPDRMLYAGLKGTIEADLELFLDRRDMSVNGDLTIKDFVFEEEFGKYAIGPINGSIPVSYSTDTAKQTRFKLPNFDRTVFDERLTQHSGITDLRDHRRITIDAFRYGFRLIEDIVLWVRQEGGLLNIASLSGNIFGGKLFGSSLIDISDRPRYHVGLVLKGLSLSDLCDSIEPIRGYISGRVDGIAHLKGAGAHLDALIGKADFWTYSDISEKTMISKEFLRKVGGPSVRAYLGNRSFDKGLMSLYIKDGFFIFNELEISNRNFIGIKDLSLKVAPLNNRIKIDHFTWTIVEAAERAKKGKQ